MIERDSQEKLKIRDKIKNIINKLNELKLSYFNSAELDSEKEYGFNFKNSNYSTTFIYLFTLIIIPIVYSLIKRYGFYIDSEKISMKDPQKLILWGHIDAVINVFIPILGIPLLFAINWKNMTKNGGWSAYSMLIFGYFSTLFSKIFLKDTGVIDKQTDTAHFYAITFLVQAIFQFMGSLILIFTNKMIRKQLLATFKEAKLDLLTWVFVFFLFCQLLILIFNTIDVQESNFLAKGISKNQTRLNSMKSIPLGVFSLVLGSVFLAPINEEISYRFGLFSLTSNKWIGYFASLIYFPSVHVMDDGDWQHIFGYLGPSIILPFLFIFSRGNISYSIGLHMALNTFAISIFFING